MNDSYQPTHQPAPELVEGADTTIAQAWQEQLAQAAHKPALAATLLRQRRALYERFVAAYRDILALSRQRRRKLLRHLGTSLAGAALALALSSVPVAYAAGITVDGACTLVDAITAANTDTATGGCAAGSGTDTITLPANGTITLTSVNNTSDGPNGLPVITSVITVTGNGATIARDGSAPLFRLFKVAYSGNLTLNDTTITGGNPGSNLNDEGLPRPFIGSGGGILNRGTTALNNSSVNGNTAIYGGGITSVQWLTLSNSSVSGNTSVHRGAGIYATNPGPYYSNPESTLTLNNSTVSGNSVSDPDGAGGGISNGATTATLNNSTVSGNTAANAGGIRNYTTLTLNNSTVSGNIVSNSYGSGGGVINSGTLMLSNSTVTGNSGGRAAGGINNFATLTLERSIISGNTAASEQEIYSTPQYCYAPDYCFGGVVNAANFNVLGHSGESNAQAFAGFTPSGSDITATSDGTTPTALAAILGALANNGGPTLTHALVTGSPAVDAASTGPATDQRGVARPQGAAFDIGAFELEQVAPATQITQLGANVQALITSGTLSGSNGGALLNKLDAAQTQLDKGNINAVITKLQDFITQVNGYIASGKLTAAQGQPLIDAANAIIQSLSVAASSAGAEAGNAAANRLFLPLVTK